MNDHTISDLRRRLFETIDGVKSGTIDIEKARLVGDLSQVIVNSAKVEVERLLRGDAAGSGATAVATSAKSSKATKAKPKSDTDTGDLFGVAADASADADGATADAPAEPQGVQMDTRYDTVLTWPVFDAWRARIYAADVVAFDTETDSLEPMKARVVGLSFSDKVGHAC